MKEEDFLIRDGKYVFRNGIPGDRPAKGWDQTDVPTFVLEYESKQAGAFHGQDNFLVVIQSFDQGKGHCTKFIELWQRYARAKGCTELEVLDPNPAVEHILRDKFGFSPKEIGPYGPVYCKKIARY